MRGCQINMSAPHPLQTNPLFGSLALLLLGAVVPAIFLAMLNSEPETSDNSVATVMASALLAVVSLVLVGVIGITLAVLSLVRKEKPVWVPILALFIGLPPVGVTLIVITVILLNT